jgi:hypothetical protein
VTGLTVGRTYNCDVIATNRVGPSNPSPPSTAFVVSNCAGNCVSAGDSSVLEGNSGTRTLKFPISLSKPVTTNVSVNYTVTGVSATGGTKAGAGVDFKLASGMITFKPGNTISKDVAVTVYGDTTVEPNETLKLTLSNPIGGGYVLGRNAGTGTIINDDGVASGIAMGIGDSAIVNTHSGNQTVSVPVTLSAPAGSTVSANYTVTPKTTTYSAKATGGDFGGALTGTLKFAVVAGKTPVAKDLTFPIWADPHSDATETFTITLSGLSGTGVTLIRPTATVTILGGY